MKNSKMVKTSALLLLSVVVGIIVADLFGRFGISDLPFILAFGAYTVLIILRRIHHGATIAVASLFVALMGASYIIQGASGLTERMGEWFYLFFIFSLIQYAKEAWL